MRYLLRISTTSEVTESKLEALIERWHSVAEKFLKEPLMIEIQYSENIAD